MTRIPLECLLKAYFNVNALALIRALVTGGATQELEQIIAEGAGICGGATADALENRKRCKVRMFSLNSGPLARFGVFLRHFGNKMCSINSIYLTPSVYSSNVRDDPTLCERIGRQALQ